MFQYSFSSDSNTKNLSGLEESILREYKRLGFGEQSIQYSINSLNYSNLPDNFPEEFTQKNRKCLRLSSCGFFQMLTYSIFEFLLSKRTPQKDQIIKKIRKQISQKSFMEDSPSTKGLLLKGLKMMYDYVQLSKCQKPIAHCMWRNDSMLAYTQFWKTLLAKISIKNIVTAQTSKALDVGLFQLLADYLQINFNIFYENQSGFQNQIYHSRRKISSLKLNMVVYSNDRNKKHECSRMLDSSSMTEKNSLVQSLEWNYVIIQDTAQYYRSQLQRNDISQIHQVQESVVEEKQEIMHLFKCKTKSQLNYQVCVNEICRNDEINNSQNGGQQKDLKGLETTRTKKSTVSTIPKSQNKKRGPHYIQRKNSSNTQQNIENIKSSMYAGDKLISDMKQFCNKLRI